MKVILLAITVLVIALTGVESEHCTVPSDCQNTSCNQADWSVHCIDTYCGCTGPTGSTGSTGSHFGHQCQSDADCHSVSGGIEAGVCNHLHQLGMPFSFHCTSQGCHCRRGH